MTSGFWHLLLLGLSACCASACGGDSSTPIENIPGDKRLVDLNASELQGVCDWGQRLAREKLAAAPSMGRCGNTQFMVMGCMQPQAGCTATVAQWMACVPNFIDRLAKDPCQVYSLLTPSALSNFIESTPSCAGLGPCGFEMSTQSP